MIYTSNLLDLRKSDSTQGFWLPSLGTLNRWDILAPVKQGVEGYGPSRFITYAKNPPLLQGLGEFTLPSMENGTMKLSAEFTPYVFV